MDKIEDLVNMPGGGLEVDLCNLDKLAVTLTEIAHVVSLDDEQANACMGRALKHCIPAWVAFIKEEKERDIPHGPGTAVYSLTRAFAMLTSLIVLGSAKNKDARQLIEPITQLFGHDLSHLIGNAEVKQHAPDTRH